MDLEQFKQLHLNRLKELDQEQKAQEREAFENIVAIKEEKRQFNKEKITSKNSKSRKGFQKKKQNFKMKEYKFQKNYV